MILRLSDTYTARRLSSLCKIAESRGFMTRMGGGILWQASDYQLINFKDIVLNLQGMYGVSTLHTGSKILAMQSFFCRDIHQRKEPL